MPTRSLLFHFTSRTLSYSPLKSPYTAVGPHSTQDPDPHANMEVLGESDYSIAYPGLRLQTLTVLAFSIGSNFPTSNLLLLPQTLFSWSFHSCLDALPITTASSTESQMNYTQLCLCPPDHQVWEILSQL